jgi:hypothetical protein
MNFPLAFDHGMLARRNRHARLLDPFAGVCGLRRNTRHVALFLNGLRNVGDGLVVQTEKERKFFCHDASSVYFAHDLIRKPVPIFRDHVPW